MLAVLVAVAIGFSPLVTARATDPTAATVTRDLERLASSNVEVAQAAQMSLIAIGPPAMPGLVEMLNHQREEVRVAAAKAVRTILVATPSAAPNDHGEAYWQKVLDQVKPGMSYEEMRKLWTSRDEAGAGSGPWMGMSVQLDDYWNVSIDFFDGKIGDKRPRVRRNVKHCWGATRPKDYSGRWTVFYVNGEKADECDYRDGKPDGLETGYYSDGRKWYETKFVDGKPVGTGNTWYPNGDKETETTYGDDTKTTRSWHQNCKLRSIIEYRDGKREGTLLSWFANGQKEREVQYRGGKKHGFDREWDEPGTLLWDRTFADGKLIEK
jgi:hypothetical protein